MVKPVKISFDSCEVSTDESLARLFDSFVKDKSEEGYFKGQTLEEKQKDIKELYSLFSHPDFREAIEKAVPKKQDRVLFFGDIADHEQWVDEELLFFVVPLLLNKDDVKDHLNVLLDGIYKTFSDRFKGHALTAYLHSKPTAVKAVLKKVMYRVLVRNLNNLMDMKFIDPIQVTPEMERNAHDRRVERRGKLVREEAAKLYSDGSRDVIQRILMDEDLDDPSGEINVALAEYRARCLDTAEEMYSIDAPLENLTKMSPRELFDMVALNSIAYTDRQERTVALMRKLVKVPDVMESELLSLQGKSLGKAGKTLALISREMTKAVAMFRGITSDKLPEGSEPKLDLLTEYELMNVDELLELLLDLRKAPKKDEQTLRKIQELQLLFTFFKNSNWAMVDPSIEDAQTINRRFGLELKEAIAHEDHRNEKVLMDSSGNLYDAPVDGVEMVDTTDVYWREYLFKRPGQTGRDSLEVYLPKIIADRKKDRSIEIKTARQDGDKPHQLYDLHRNMLVFNLKPDQMKEGGDSQHLVEAMAARRMNALGCTERVPNNTKRKNLKPGQYKIDFSKMEENGNEQSLGLRVVKVYYRTHATDKNEHGVGGEEQYFPKETYLKYCSPNHILHPRFYAVKKMIQIVRQYFSETVFKQFHAYADWLERQLDHLEEIAAENDGYVVKRVCEKDSTQTMLPVIGPDIEDEVTDPSVAPLD